MRSNKLDEYLKILFKYTVALIFAMFIKVIVIDMAPVNASDDITVNNPEIKTELKYTEEEYKFETEPEESKGFFKKPHFNDDKLNKFTDDYIATNSCQNLEYHITELGNNMINLFLNCGTPSYYIYDYQKRAEISFVDLVKDYDSFIANSKRLLNLKYPTFVTDDILFDQAVYDIRLNEIIAYYKTNEFKDASITINNNEIKELMTYNMNYDDAYENETFKLDPTKKTVAFTFDDGPSTYDLKIIDALVNSHSTATFYMVGNRMKSFPASIQKMVETGMEMGNHTYDHKSLTGLSDELVKEQITKTNNIFYEMTGKNLTSLRPSYGNINKRVRLQVGMPVVLWSIDTLDWKSRNAQKVYDIIINESADGDIILMHSLYDSTLKAVEMALPELYKRGFQVVSVGELAKLKGKTLTAGASVWNLK